MDLLRERKVKFPEVAISLKAVYRVIFVRIYSFFYLLWTKLQQNVDLVNVEISQD